MASRNGCAMASPWSILRSPSSVADRPSCSPVRCVTNSSTRSSCRRWSGRDRPRSRSWRPWVDPRSSTPGSRRSATLSGTALPPRRPPRRTPNSGAARPRTAGTACDGGESMRDFVARIRTGVTGFLADRGVERSEMDLPVWQIRGAGCADRSRRPRRYQLGHRRASPRTRAGAVGVGPIRSGAHVDQPARGNAARRRIHVLSVEAQRRRAPGPAAAHPLTGRPEPAIYRRAMPEAPDPDRLKFYSFSRLHPARAARSPPA